MPIHFLDGIYFMPLLLTALAWVVIIALLRSGLTQINDLKQDTTPAPESP